MKKISVIVSLVVVAILFVSLVLMGIGYSNTEVELRNQAVAQQKANEVIYDKVWKVIKSKAQVTDKYASDFKDIYGSIMEGRYQGDATDNPAFKWIHEHNPEFSVQMYKDLSDSIEGLRNEFAMVQNRLVDIKREHDNLRMRIPSRFFVGGRPELEIKVVTSTKTTETFKTQKEDDISVF